MRKKLKNTDYNAGRIKSVKIRLIRANPCAISLILCDDVTT